MSIELVRNKLAREFRVAGSASAWGKKNGISAAYISDVMNKRKEPGIKILEAIGLERIVTYRKKPEGCQRKQGRE